MSHASITYISASTNRHSQAADASSASLVVFGSSKFVALWDVAADTDQGVSVTLPGHEGLVTCVRFLEGDDSFLSADDKGSVRLWRKTDLKWKVTCILQAHSKPVSALAVHDDCVVTGSSDATVTVWKLAQSAAHDHDELQEVQKLDLRGGYPLNIQLATLPGTSSLIMAVSTTDRNIGIWTRSENNFVRAASLSGHEDWVKSLAFQDDISSPGTLTLASGSQDGTIRLWNIERYEKDPIKSISQAGDVLGDDLLDDFEAALGDIAEGEEGGRQISMKRYIIVANTGGTTSRQFTITFDALLIGHEAGVTSLTWCPMRRGSDPLPTLLSTSTDSSLILWSPTSLGVSAEGGSPSLWINRQRFGDIGGQKLGGFVGGLWAGGGEEVLAWGWNGGWRRWRRLPPDDQANGEVWDEVGAISGHSGPVKGLAWSPQGEYMISTSLDQTTRVHGNVNGASQSEVWHELGRPQVHGYDLVNAIFLDSSRFVSIADEKVARVFESPRRFTSLIRNLGIFTGAINEDERPAGASVPPLGLSNKASIVVSENQSTDNSSNIHRRPFEGELASTTLWPEIEKVFGHGYELISLSASHSGKYIATACKATTSEHAVIRVYDTQTWQLFGQPLEGHALSVTRITFSPDDRFILSVSRDRTWRLFVVDEAGYMPIAADKSHARIIWDCAWAWEGDVFATAARDKTVKIWKSEDRPGKNWIAVATLKMREAATAVAFSPEGTDFLRRVAIGLESGKVCIYKGETPTPEAWHEELVLDHSIAHVDHIYRLAWRPPSSGDSSNRSQLASCSEDGTLRLLSIHLSPDKNPKTLQKMRDL